MSKFVDRPRYTCALGGALYTLRALRGAVPIIHAGTGCGYNIYTAMNPGAGYFGGGRYGGTSWSSSNVVEKEIVFGGEDRLEEQVRTTIELIDGDLYVIVTGCMVEMIGDDAAAVAERFTDAPVIAVSTPSFKGNSYDGYDMLLTALFENYAEKGRAVKKGVVNVFGLVPGQDAFYKGNLAEIKRLLSSLGLTVNTFFGEYETLDNLRFSSEAELNIVLSDIYGVKSAEAFEKTHNVPFITAPLPIGAAQSDEFLRKVAGRLNISPETVESVIEKENSRYYDYFERLADIYSDIDLQRYSVLIGDSNYIPAAARFVADELGWIPKVAVITDFVDGAQKTKLLKRFDNWESATVPAVKFDTDTSSLSRYIAKEWGQSNNQKYYDAFSPAVIIGSVFERDLSAKYGFPLFTLCYPLTNRVVMNQCYAGYSGGIALASDLITQLISGR